MPIRDFYAPAHHGDPFGIVNANHPTPHRGDDTNGWSAGTPIPALFGGQVVRKELGHVLGNLVSIRRADGVTFGYCHMNSASPLTVGQQIHAGDTVGYLGNTGTASHGNHVHVTAMPTGNDPALSAVVDPRPYIDAAISGTSPADGGATPIIDPFQEDTTMPRNYNAGGTIFTLGETFGTLWTNPADFSYLTNMAAWGPPVSVAMTADQVATAINECNARGKAYSQVGASTTTALTAADVAAIDASLQDEFAAALAAIHGIPAAPTAAENGAAARAAIVK